MTEKLSQEQRETYGRMFDALIAKRDRLRSDIHSIEVQLAALGTRIGRDVSFLSRPTVPQAHAYEGWTPIEAIRDYLTHAERPLAPEAIVEELEARGLKPGNVRRAISGATKTPGKRKGGEQKKASLKVFAGGKIGLPDWPDEAEQMWANAQP